MSPNTNENNRTDKKILVTPEFVVKRKYGNLQMIFSYLFGIAIAAIAIKAYTMDMSQYLIIGLIVGTLLIAGVIVAVKNKKKADGIDDTHGSLVVTVEPLLFKYGGKGLLARNCSMEFESGQYRVMSDNIRDFHLSRQGDMFYLIHRGKQGNILGAYNANYYKLCPELESHIIDK